MSDTTGAPPPEATPAQADRLQSWKEIAGYLQRGVSTAQRWSRTEGLPVHRLPHAKAGTVFAYRSEIDAWWRDRSERLSAEVALDEDDVAAPSSEPYSPEPHVTIAPAPSGLTNRRLVLALPILLLIAIVWSWGGQRGPALGSLAVLPFVNGDGDQDYAYLSDGITEHLINTLSQTPDLRVTARPHAFRYSRPDVDPQQAGRELDVSAVLTGRVMQRDGVLHVQVDLIDVDQGSQLWGRQYKQQFADILALQQQIAGEVSERLGIPAANRRTSPARRSTTNVAAYEAYLKGRYYWNRRTEDAIRRAVEHFEVALAKDPGYALAAAGLADCYAVYSIYQLESPRQAGPRARLAATRALQLDETMAEPHAALGFVKTHYEWDWPGAEQAFQRSLELDRNNANAHFWYAVYLSAIGRTDLSTTEALRAQQLDPLSLVIRAGAGGEPGMYAARRYDESIAQIKTALELDPGFAVGYLWLAMPYLQKGMHADAVAMLEKAVALSGNSPLSLGPLGHAYAVSRSPDKARRVLSQLKEMASYRYVSPFDTALVHLGLEDDHETFLWLERALEDRSYRMHWLKVDPRFDRLRRDRRFTRMLERMGLSP